MARILVLAVLVSFLGAATAQGRPSPPQARLSVVVESKLIAFEDFPVALKLTCAGAGLVVHSSDIEVFLLAEDGSEVAQGLFIPLDVPQTAEPKDHDTSLAFKFRWDPYMSQHVETGKRYQLVILIKRGDSGRVAGATWFTLLPRSKP